MTAIEALRAWIDDRFYARVDNERLWRDAASGVEFLEKSGFTIAVKNVSEERVKSLLARLFEAWSMGEQPDPRDIAEARTICAGQTTQADDRLDDVPDDLDMIEP